MKKILLLLALALTFAAPVKLDAQQAEIEQLLLDLQKLSYLRSILQDLRRGYDIVFAGYNTIKNISRGNFNLHEQFLNALLEVSPAVKSYKKIADIISAQVELVREYQRAVRGFRLSGLFAQGELDYITRVSRSLLDRSVKNLEELAMVITSGKMRMSDAERLSQIDDLYTEATNELTFLRQFNSEAKLLAAGRLRQQAGLSNVQRICGVHP